MAKHNQKKNSKQPEQPSPVKANHTVQAPENALYLKYSYIILALICLVLYIPSYTSGFTDLDDTIFIRDMAGFNENWDNLRHAFSRGVFVETGDTYYRPVFLVSMILNNQLTNGSIESFHFWNIIIHAINACLVFKLFLSLKLSQKTSFILAVLFAIHPVLSQAVSWIPGRNDSLLMLFAAPAIIFSIKYIEKPGILNIAGSAIFILLSFFTKESGIFLPIAILILLYGFIRTPFFSRPMIRLYLVWLLCGIIYMLVRSTASLNAEALSPVALIQAIPYRLPLVIQYLGKIILPFNLNVFPVIADTNLWFGIGALVILLVLIFTGAKQDRAKTWSGLLFFLVFLIPLLLVPQAINDQVFEHRLYLPLLGFLLILPQTVFFNGNIPLERTRLIFGAVAIILAGINWNHQSRFKDPVTFWESAYEQSPSSAYATMMYAARVDDKQEGYRLMRQAYALNPEEKYLNYYYGVMLVALDSPMYAESHFLKEKKRSDYYECDFYLARIAHMKNDIPSAIGYLENYVRKDSVNMTANNNLLLMYIETRQKSKAQQQAKRMQRNGIQIPDVNLKQIEAIP